MIPHQQGREQPLLSAIIWVSKASSCSADKVGLGVMVGVSVAVSGGDAGAEVGEGLSVAVWRGIVDVAKTVGVKGTLVISAVVGEKVPPTAMLSLALP